MNGGNEQATTAGDEVLSAPRVAAAVAPMIDRIRVSIARAVPAVAADLAQQYELDQPAVQTMSMLRHIQPHRRVTTDDVLAVFAYAPQAQVLASLDALCVSGQLVRSDGSLELGDSGRAFLRELYVLIHGVVDAMWDGRDELVDAAAPLVTRAIEAAAASGGPAFGVMTPQYVPPGASAAVVLAEQLSALRFHRFDAHVRAWKAAGLSATEVQQFGPGRQRDEIERETNRVAAAPYELLSPAERFELCAALGALPN